MSAFMADPANQAISMVYVGSMALTLLQALCVVLHPQHRALHDLLAGTVVLRRKRPAATREPVREAFACLQCGARVEGEENVCPVCGWTFAPPP